MANFTSTNIIVSDLMTHVVSKVSTKGLDKTNIDGTTLAKPVSKVRTKGMDAIVKPIAPPSTNNLAKQYWF